MMRQAVGLSLLSVVLLTGCATEIGVRGAFPGPVAAEPLPAPPPPRYEVIPVAPGPAHVWIAGHWVWRPERHEHVWIPGAWRYRG